MKGERMQNIEVKETSGRSTTIEQSPTPCNLLELAAELRNEIWELAFTSDTESSRAQDLLNPSPPSSALLRTCRQIYQEAKGLHDAARQRYWSTSIFEIKDAIPLCATGTFQKIKSMRKRDIRLINRIRLPIYDMDPEAMKRPGTAFWQNGVWQEFNGRGQFAEGANTFIWTLSTHHYRCRDEEGKLLRFNATTWVLDGRKYGMVALKHTDTREIAAVKQHFGWPYMTKWELLAAITYCMKFVTY
ncbi:hypothetical protein EJ03DRAFT_327968 [Teratosphaeria nubilosa]|uniref:Uncharacterized protein n=1 Tax=Teratosphaeria nubilosa TaxID=161662 RepID=A0A6G1L7C9_9PEZI|nr:hypothetical protein EJ03DRAFT_327968 [Teratosphaeria nubilosa]